MKRVYKSVGIAETADGYAVELDGRPIRTPDGRAVIVPTRSLARLIASEWAAQGAEVKPATMPATQHAVTVLDRVTPRREAVIEEIAAYGATDLLCYRAAEPPELVNRQDHLWQPYLDWAREALGAELTVSHSIMPTMQSGASQAALAAAVRDENDLALGPLHRAVALSGSLVLPLAVLHGHATMGEVTAAALVEDRHQLETWGHDDLAAQRLNSLEAELRTIDAFWRALGRIGT